MQQILDWIEHHLDAQISPRDIADEAGYSLWHFSRLFLSEVGMTPARYVTRRRLAHALWAISQGESVTNAALRYGFDTHAGFYKAFCREYGCPPTEYLRAHRAQKPRPLRLAEEEYLMLNHDTWKKALAAWGMADLPLAPAVYEPSGTVADNVCCAGSGLILKAYRDPVVCRRALHMAHALHEAGLPASLPLALPDGQEMLEIAGCFITLSHRLEGSPLRPADMLSGDAHGNGHLIGCTLRQLHSALDAVALPDLTDLPIGEHILSWALPKARPCLPANFPADFEERAAALDNLPRGAIHRDPNPGNLLSLPDGRIGLIDFDLAERSVRLYDLCYASTGILMECMDDSALREKWPQLLQGILDGYEASAAEREAAMTMVLGIEVICLAAFVGSEKYKRAFDFNLRVVEWLCGRK